MILFDGNQFAQQREADLQKVVAELKAQGKHITVAAILFTEDKGSQLYTGLKQQAAQRVGIEYRVFSFSVTDSLADIQQQLKTLNEDSNITGIIIQKPWRKTWEAAVLGESSQDFQNWWLSLVTTIDPHKDVDGLHPDTLAAVKDGSWKGQGKVLPATAKAVLSILDSSHQLQAGKYIVIGKSDILGKPLAYELHNLGFEVEMIGKKDLESRVLTGQLLKDGDVVISATGQQRLVTGEMVKEGVVLVDVGEPRPDIDRRSVEKVASFLTPVPGGVGPVTVVSLLENAVELAKKV
ncbi:bifunctional 5,10-methylenetetrahydrofolate dehydrogenase/5,10-methenyltetrahydrofolate cyclohydrolase [Patescibacteria group bacterium]|nr:bifunctional 5,10-methylenetetrahydrofolate dehydrogenase/5,10-methenyltetrahydrofolate cyclohydrolase [Patescibacteria group bacterium]